MRTYIRPTTAVTYLRETWGIKVTRQTIYNWVKDGVQGRRLQPANVPTGSTLFRVEDLDDYARFILDCQLPQTRS